MLDTDEEPPELADVWLDENELKTAQDKCRAALKIAKAKVEASRDTEPVRILPPKHEAKNLKSEFDLKNVINLPPSSMKPNIRVPLPSEGVDQTKRVRLSSETSVKMLPAYPQTVKVPGYQTRSDRLLKKSQIYLNIANS